MRSNDFSRVEPIELIQETSGPLNSGWILLLSEFSLSVSISLLIIFILLTLNLHLPATASIPTDIVMAGLLGSLVYRRFDPKTLQLEYEYCRCTAAHVRGVLELDEGAPVDAGEVDCQYPTWLCTAEDFKRAAIAHRRSQDRGRPTTKYKRLLAARPASGQNRRLAFADGTAEMWGHSKHFLMKRGPRVAVNGSDNGPEVEILRRITSILTIGPFADGRLVPCGHLREKSGSPDPRDFLRTLRVLSAWAC